MPRFASEVSIGTPPPEIGRHRRGSIGSEPRPDEPDRALSRPSTRCFRGERVEVLVRICRTVRDRPHAVLGRPGRRSHGSASVNARNGFESGPLGVGRIRRNTRTTTEWRGHRRTWAGSHGRPREACDPPGHGFQIPLSFGIRSPVDLALRTSRLSERCVGLSVAERRIWPHRYADRYVRPLFDPGSYRSSLRAKSRSVREGTRTTGRRTAPSWTPPGFDADRGLSASDYPRTESGPDTDSTGQFGIDPPQLGRHGTRFFESV